MSKIVEMSQWTGNKLTIIDGPYEFVYIRLAPHRFYDVEDCEAFHSEYYEELYQQFINNEGEG